MGNLLKRVLFRREWLNRQQKDLRELRWIANKYGRETIGELLRRAETSALDKRARRHWKRLYHAARSQPASFWDRTSHPIRQDR